MSTTNKAVNPIMRKQRLQKLLEAGREIRSTSEVEGSIETIEKITNIIKESDLLNKQVDSKHSSENTTEVVMDVQVIKMGHELIGEVMQKMGTTEFSDEEFINSIVRLVYGDSEENWNALGEIATRVAKTSKFSSCLLGSFEHDPIIEEKKEKEIRRRKKKDLGVEQKPENVTKLDKQEKSYKKVNLVLKRIKALYKENNRRPIPLYKLIIDPEDFMCTADNAFQIAFLARDGSIAVQQGNDGFPTVEPTSKQAREDTNDNNETVQGICSLNPAFCQKMIKKYKIREPLLIINREELDESQRLNHSQRS